MRAGVAGSGDFLYEAFASLSLNGTTLNGSTDLKHEYSEAKVHGKQPQRKSSDSKDLPVVLMAMRKIREAIVASKRKDAFALRAYIFIIRATILAKHMESYHPALLYLLNILHPIHPLTGAEHKEFVGYYILDLACRQNDLAAAYQVKCDHAYTGMNIVAFLKAVVHGDWCTFWKNHKAATKHQKCLMEWAEEGMRKRALDCLGMSYLTVDKEYLERAVQRRWKDLVEKNSVAWQLEGNVIMIKRLKGK